MYNKDMDRKQFRMKIKTHQKLQFLASLQQKPMCDVLDIILDNYLERNSTTIFIKDLMKGKE